MLNQKSDNMYTYMVYKSEHLLFFGACMFAEVYIFCIACSLHSTCFPAKQETPRERI